MGGETLRRIGLQPTGTDHNRTRTECQRGRTTGHEGDVGSWRQSGTAGRAVSPNCCGCSTRVMNITLPPGGIGSWRRNGTVLRDFASPVGLWPQHAREGANSEECSVNYPATTTTAFESGQLCRAQYNTAWWHQQRSSIRGCPSGTTRLTRAFHPGGVPSALSDSIPCRDYSMGRLFPLAGRGVTPNIIKAMPKTPVWWVPLNRQRLRAGWSGTVIHTGPGLSRFGAGATR